jgi:hypothetical protein
VSPACFRRQDGAQLSQACPPLIEGGLHDEVTNPRGPRRRRSRRRQLIGSARLLGRPTEARPGESRQRSTQRRQEQAVNGGEPWTAGLSTQDRQLVSQNQDLQFLRATRAGQQPHDGSPRGFVLDKRALGGGGEGSTVCSRGGKRITIDAAMAQRAPTKKEGAG